MNINVYPSTYLQPTANFGKNRKHQKLVWNLLHVEVYLCACKLNQSMPWLTQAADFVLSNIHIYFLENVLQILGGQMPTSLRIITKELRFLDSKSPK